MKRVTKQNIVEYAKHSQTQDEKAPYEPHIVVSRPKCMVCNAPATVETWREAEWYYAPIQDNGITDYDNATTCQNGIDIISTLQFCDKHK
jgi:hypothetical protein